MFKIEHVPSHYSPKEEILALGTDTRRRISWSARGLIFSLGTTKDYSDPALFYRQAVSFLIKKHGIKPEIIAFDPHPLFFCSKEAVRLKEKFFPRAKLRPVFHHVAHVARFAVDVGLKKSFIGVAFDGTGFGQDRRVWGGEFFLYQRQAFQRVAHFEYQLLLGNEAAIREPWRMALAIIYRIYGKKFFKKKWDFLRHVSRQEAALLLECFDAKFNAPETSSVGRLFDAAAALTGLKSIVRKEAEAAVCLEQAARGFKGCAKAYPFCIKKGVDTSMIDVAPLFKGMVEDLRDKKSVSEIAFKFHVTLAEVVRRMCGELKKKTGINMVYLSGGVFMNEILQRESEKRLRQDGFDVVFAGKPATTDLGISEGQIATCCMVR